MNIHTHTGESIFTFDENIYRVKSESESEREKS
jgi:hypothetical protein